MNLRDSFPLCRETHSGDYSKRTKETNSSGNVSDFLLADTLEPNPNQSGSAASGNAKKSSWKGPAVVTGVVITLLLTGLKLKMKSDTDMQLKNLAKQ
ncbi:uncharacterized protein KZ484_023763 isoform 2-T2 [Pholidichthys leucotaenia]